MASPARAVPVVLSYGFRPFFFAASMLAGVLIGLWGPASLGLVHLPGALGPVQWHGHELLFGYVPAVIAGFMLTAVPSWTGRAPIIGARLGVLVALWLLGRIAVLASQGLDARLLAGLTLLFPVIFAGMIGREIALARNWRNLKVVGLLALLGTAQALFHADIARGGSGLLALRAAMAVILLLIMLIGGRIIPAFTRNWLRKNNMENNLENSPENNPGREPPEFNRVDTLAMILGGMGLASWLAAEAFPTALPAARGAFGLVLLAAGGANALRLARWTPLRTRAEPLLGVLHLAYGFVPVGFVLAGCGLLRADPALGIAALHAFGIGAILLMTFAVMARATRGHSGRPLTAPPGTVLVFAGLVVAALLRIIAAFCPEHAFALLLAASLTCSLACFGFAALHARMLLLPAP